MNLNNSGGINMEKIIIVLFVFIAVVRSKDIQCEKYDAGKCKGGDIAECTSIETCSVESAHDRPNNCFVLWKEDLPGNITVSLKGCFTQNQACDQSECVDTNFASKQKNIRFCCCYGSLCNREHRWQPITTEVPETNSNDAVPAQSGTKPLMQIVLVVIISVTVALAVISAIYFYKQKQRFNQLPTSDPEGGLNGNNDYDISSIQLLELKASGRYGQVWKAAMQPEEVAVKIFQQTDKSWLVEQEIFKLPRMKHSNVLKFIAAGKKEDELGSMQLWLVTSYHPQGSLCDYLKSNTVTWQEMCKIAESMARGLMHLHEEIPASKFDGLKPSIAHRDFKSKNVLLKSDLTACIADFGLALIFKPGEAIGDNQGQVGTRRYMAPEILEAAINFTRDAFLRIDVYACGLVLWELVSRCTAHSGTINDFRLPFEEEIDVHPTLEQMQDFVVTKKMRPRIPAHWRKHAGLAAFCDTMEECWDHDAEARLSSSCVVERVSQHLKYPQTPLMIETNTSIGKEATDST